MAHAFAGWGLCAALVAGVLLLSNLTAVLTLHALAAPIFFTAIAWHYFRARGAREPLPTAMVWTAVVAVLDFAVVGITVPRGLEMWKSLAGAWLPFTLIFFSTWLTGFIMSMLPLPLDRVAAKARPVTA